MKLAFLGRRDIIHLARWANAFARLGNEVSVVSSHPDRNLLNSRVEQVVLPYQAPYGYFFNTLALRGVLEAISPDLLNVHFASGYGTLGSLSQFHPRVLSVWGSDVYEFPNKSPIHRWLISNILRSADLISSTSKTMAERTKSIYEREIHVIPFGIDVNEFSPSSEEKEKRSSLTIGTVRFLEEKYGVDVLIRAFARVIESYNEGMKNGKALKLIIIGEGSQRAQLQLLTNDLGLRDQVHFMGWISHNEIPRYLNKMDIFVAPSRYESESFCVAVLEASSCELPVVVSDIGGLPETVEDGITGLVIESENVDELADALITLIRNPEMRIKFGNAGRHRVIDRYEWNKCVRMMENVYQDVLNRQS